MRLRLLKVIVQPVYVEGDSELLTERAAQPIEVAPADWPDFPTRLEAERAAMEAAGEDNPDA